MNTRYGFVSTFPPTQCGLATFAASLRAGLVRHGGTDSVVVRLVETPEQRPAPEVVAQIVPGDRASLYRGVARTEPMRRRDPPARVRRLRRGRRRRDPSAAGRIEGPQHRRAAHGPGHAERESAPCARGRGREGRLGRHDVDGGPRSARSRLRRRHAQDQHHRARCIRGRRDIGDVLPQRRAAGRAHLGTARAGQGHRVGHRGDGEAARSGPDAAIRHRRPDPPQGGAARGRDLPQLAAGTCSSTRLG